MKLIKYILVLFILSFSSCTQLTYWKPVLNKQEYNKLTIAESNLEITIFKMKVYSTFLFPELKINIKNNGTSAFYLEDANFFLTANQDTTLLHIKNIDSTEIIKIKPKDDYTINLSGNGLQIKNQNIYYDSTMTFHVALHIPEFKYDSEIIEFPKITFHPEDKDGIKAKIL
jgi:hypothetical protein